MTGCGAAAIAGRGTVWSGIEKRPLAQASYHDRVGITVHAEEEGA